MASYPEVETVVAQIGRPDDGTDPAGFYNVEFFVPLRPQKDWPKVGRADRLAALALRPQARRGPRRSWSTR